MTGVQDCPLATEVEECYLPRYKEVSVDAMLSKAAESIAEEQKILKFLPKRLKNKATPRVSREWLLVLMNTHERTALESLIDKAKERHKDRLKETGASISIRKDIIASATKGKGFSSVYNNPQRSASKRTYKPVFVECGNIGEYLAKKKKDDRDQN